MPFVLLILATKLLQNKKLFYGLLFQYLLICVVYNGYIVFFRAHGVFFVQ